MGEHMSDYLKKQDEFILEMKRSWMRVQTQREEEGADGGAEQILAEIEKTGGSALNSSSADGVTITDADLGFTEGDITEFASMGAAELKAKLAVDDKELELMREHTVLTVEHAKVKKMLLADKDHELQEYEYQWGVAKANMAASEGELMIVDEEVSILKGLVTQTHRYHLQQSRTGKLP